MDMTLAGGRWFILNLIPCPSCNGRLEPCANDSEWSNVACTFCDYTCRMVTAANRPADALLAVPRRELEDALQLKKTLGPLMIHFRWEAGRLTCERVILYPFIAYRFLQEESSRRIMFERNDGAPTGVFDNMFEIPSIELYHAPSVPEMVRTVKGMEGAISVEDIRLMFGCDFEKARTVVKRLRELQGEGE